MEAALNLLVERAGPPGRPGRAARRGKNPLMAEASVSGGPVSCENEIVPPALRTRKPLTIRYTYSARPRSRRLARALEGEEDEAGSQAQLRSGLRSRSPRRGHA